MLTTQTKRANISFIDLICDTLLKFTLYTKVTLGHCLHHQTGSLKLTSTNTNSQCAGGAT